MADLNELAKDMGIKLPAGANKPITAMINKYKKNKKIKGDISDALKKQAIKRHMNRLTKKHHAEEYPAAIKGALARGTAKKEGIKGLSIFYKKGGKIETYAKGRKVRKPKY